MRTGREPYLPSWLPNRSNASLGIRLRIEGYRLFSANESEELSQGLVGDGVLRFGSLLLAMCIASTMTLLTILSAVYAA